MGLVTDFNGMSDVVLTGEKDTWTLTFQHDIIGLRWSVQRSAQGPGMAMAVEL